MTMSGESLIYFSLTVAIVTKKDEMSYKMLQRFFAKHFLNLFVIICAKAYLKKSLSVEIL